MTNCDLCGGTGSSPFLTKGDLAYARCTACGFVQADMSPEEFERCNETEFSASLEEFAAKANDPRRRRRYCKRLAALESFRTHGRIVELGSNCSAFLLAAREAGWAGIGIEPVEACARHARERHDLDVRTCVLKDAELESGSCDVVYAHAVLEHLTSPRTVLAEVARILRSALDQAGMEVRRMASHGVRLRPSGAERLPRMARLVEELRKLPLSAAARFTLRGESVAALAVRRP